MAKIKVKIQDLFDRFGMNENPTENNKEISWKNEKDIKVKKPDGEFTNINEFVKKWCDSYKIIFSNNKELICSDKHILMTANGEKEVKNIDNDSILLSNGDYTNIKSIKLHKKNDILYDICIDYPHLFVDTNGLIHHNSLIVSYLIKILSENNEANQSLIIVPTLSLITQFKKDMIDYGIDKEKIGIANKDKKEFDSDIVVSTWQVLQNRKDILENFDLVICDEVHQSKGREINSIMRACKCKYKFGVTGTIPDHPLEKMRVISYIGPIWKEYNAKWLADNGYLSHCKVKQIKIKYKEGIKSRDYEDIRKDIFRREYRLNIIKGITNNLENSLILVERVEDEGEFIKEYLSENLKNKTVVFLSGKNKPEEREKWREKMEKEKNVVLIATYGIFSTGINIKALNNILLISSSKSKIRVLQSIGRSLRLHENKRDGWAIIWDFSDQVKNLRDHSNSRNRFYDKEEFETETIEMNEKVDKNINKLFE